MKEEICRDPDDHQMFNEICLYIVSVYDKSVTCSLIGFILLKFDTST